MFNGFSWLSSIHALRQYKTLRDRLIVFHKFVDSFQMQNVFDLTKIEKKFYLSADDGFFPNFAIYAR